MIDAEMSFAKIEAAAPAKRLPTLVGLGFGALVSVGLWAALGLTVARLF